MIKLIKRVFVCLLAVLCFYAGTLIADRQRLDQELIRVHVVADSDSEEAQRIKLQVRDAVEESLGFALRQVSDTEAAKTYIRENLDWIRSVANEKLAELGSADTVQITFDREKFDARAGDPLSLPAGIYHALRITIGNGQGQNWWGVLFPEAVGSELPAALTDSLSGTENGQLRFFLLDLMGQLENRLY